MGTRATRKDFYMEIRKSFGRFMSIFLIVALGVAFFSGIRAAEPAMRITGDAYFDKSNLMDIQVMSTLGITHNDLEVLSKVKGVEGVEGAYSADFLSGEGEKQAAVHVMSYSEKINEITLSQGRLPEKEGECLADDEMEYKVGDNILLRSGDDKPVTDILKTNTLKVVGKGNSPRYISFGRGSTTIGTGSISGFLVVPKETFDMEVYTEGYVRTEGTKELTAYTKAYDKKVESVIERIQDISKEQRKVRKQELIDEAQAELAKAEKELLDGQAQAEKELDEAAGKIADGEKAWNDARIQLADGRQKIAQAKATLLDKQKELDAAWAQYSSGIEQLNQGKNTYDQGKAEYAKQAAQLTQSEQQAMAELQRQRELLNELSRECDLLQQKIDETEDETEARVLKEKLSAMQQQLAQGQEQYEAGRQQTEASLEGGRQQLAAGAAALADSERELADNESRLNQVRGQIDAGRPQIQAGWNEIRAQEAAITSGEAELAAKEPELDDAKKAYEEGKAQAEQKLAEGRQEITDAQREIRKIKQPKWYINDRDILPEHSGYGENADRMKAIGKVFPVLFFLVAALISLTTMTRMVEEQRVEIGTMKALGYGKFTIASKYLGYALLATLGGSVFGVLIGEKLLPYIIIYAYGIMYLHLPEIIVPYHWGYAVAATLSAVACTMIATLSACYRELSDQPAALMRPPAPKKGTRVFLERLTFIWRHLSFIWKATVRNLMRYKKRFLMTVIGIGGCMALMLVGFGLRDSILDIGDLQYGQIQAYDGSAYLMDDISKEERADLEKSLKKDTSIKQYMDVHVKNITLVSKGKEREAYETVPRMPGKMDEYIHLQSRLTKEKITLSDKGVVLSEKTAKLLDAKEGDTIYIKDEESENIPVKLEGICENYMGHYVYFTPTLYTKLYGEETDYNSVFYRSSAQTKKEREKIGQRILAAEGVQNVSYLHDIQKQLNDMLGSLDMVIVVLIISAGMLAFVVLYNLNNVNITERQRELATIKVLGFYDRELAAYVYRENILLTVIGACAGMLMGRLLHLFVVRTVEVDAVMFGRNINSPSYLYSLLFTVAFSLFVNGVMYFKLKRIDMVESLKSVE